MREGRPIEKTYPTREAVAELVAEPPPDDTTEEAPSDHLRMQWKLLEMGRRAGETVWVPRGDQKRLRDGYAVNGFERQFAAGLDTEKRYVENIDVVWKEEFRIDGAFEIEHSTAIYSGLLRFADLTTVAPNTLYPMFIVAPAERRQQVAQQLGRPTFQRLRLSEKVRYLSYEAVDEVDKFFGESAAGLSIDVMVGKSEKLACA